jgi:dTDP-4-amino-4,6-dideoxygalactose transaminase
MTTKPALLGGFPIFSRKLQFARPALPSYAEIGEDIRELLESGIVTKGRYVTLLEKAAASYLGIRHVIAVSSCTLGLMLTYQSLGLKDEAVVPSFTFMATVSALVWAGIRPLFVDVEPQTMNLDPDLVEAAITRDTTAIVAVHNFGNPVNIDVLQSIADRKGVRLIFDAAQSIGSMFEGQVVGAQGDAQVFSLTPSKLLVAGEGGLVATNNDELAEKIRIGREYGNDGNYNGIVAGLNARLPEMSALLALYNLSRLEDAARRRNSIAATYRDRLSALPGVAFQEVLRESRCSYTYFAITVDPDLFGLDREELACALAAENIETRNYYDPPVHLQTAYRQYARTSLSHTERLAARVLCLPIWSDMDDSTVWRICQAIEQAHSYQDQIRGRLSASLSAVV